MELFAPPVERLIEEFAKLPGIGQKTAQRLAFHVLDLPKEDAERFAMPSVKQKPRRSPAGAVRI